MAWDEWAYSRKTEAAAWIETIKEDCIRESQHTGIYPSVMIAMTVLESYAGTSNLAVNHYNFLGMTMPEHLVGKVAVFWDGSAYRRANYISNRSWADYTQAGDFRAGFVLCLRHYGMNFWATEAYEENGVLSHVSSGLSPAEAVKDAKLQLGQLVPIFAPEFDNNVGYEDEILSIIELYDLWKVDEAFLSRGGWNGVSHYPLPKK